MSKKSDSLEWLHEYLETLSPDELKRVWEGLQDLRDHREVEDGEEDDD